MALHTIMVLDNRSTLTTHRTGASVWTWWLLPDEPVHELPEQLGTSTDQMEGQANSLTSGLSHYSSPIVSML
ncbi:hypothetical protein ACTRXD_06000 [Nitrospira sp. T9]|uniref:hypothetical protein n=1 Tax=unclassified Nitrospira TaxID=2652172 RepID=UPI003F97D6FD